MGERIWWCQEHGHKGLETVSKCLYAHFTDSARSCRMVERLLADPAVEAAEVIAKTHYRLWWCGWRQSWMAKQCGCNTYDLFNACGWVEHTRLVPVEVSDG